MPLNSSLPVKAGLPVIFANSCHCKHKAASGPVQRLSRPVFAQRFVVSGKQGTSSGMQAPTPLYSGSYCFSFKQEKCSDLSLEQEPRSFGRGLRPVPCPCPDPLPFSLPPPHQVGWGCPTCSLGRHPACLWVWVGGCYGVPGLGKAPREGGAGGPTRWERSLAVRYPAGSDGR